MLQRRMPAVAIIGYEGLQKTDGSRAFRRILSLERSAVFNRSDQLRNRSIVGMGGQKFEHLSIGIDAYIKFADEFKDHPLIEDYRGITLLAGQSLGVPQGLGEHGAGSDCRHAPKRPSATPPLKSVSNAAHKLETRVRVRGRIGHRDLTM